MPDPQSLVGTWRRFGPAGPVYEIIGLGSELADGDRMIARPGGRRPTTATAPCWAILQSGNAPFCNRSAEVNKQRALLSNCK